MDLYSGYQVVPRYFSDIYTAIYVHVNVQDFHGLPGPERLRSHPVQRREVVVRRLYNLLLPPGTHTYQRLVEFSWHMRLARRLPVRTKSIFESTECLEPAESPSLRSLLLLLLFSYRLGDATLTIRLRISICSWYVWVVAWTPFTSRFSASIGFGAPTFGATWNAAWATGAVVVAVAVIVTMVGAGQEYSLL